MGNDRRKRCDRPRLGVTCNFCISRRIACLDPLAETLDSSKRSYEPLDHHADEGRSRHTSSLLAPDLALREELVELYFRYAHIAFHNLFHRPTLIASVRNSSVPKVIFFGIASLSARYSTNAAFNSIAAWDRGRPYKEEARRLMDLENISLTTIQACMLLSANASVEGESFAEAVYHAAAARMATLPVLDLPTIPTQPLLEREINKRVWWSLITTVTWTSTIHSLPRIVPRDDLPLPMDEKQFLSLDYSMLATTGDFVIQEALPPGAVSESLVAQMIRLNILLYEIMLLNTRVVAEHIEESEQRSSVEQLALNFEEWVRNLSPLLQYSDENVAYRVQEGLGAMFITLHINYNHAGELFILSSSISRMFAHRCKHHATNLCDLIYRAKERPETVVMYPLAGHILCLASTVQIHKLLFDVDDNEILSAKMRLERNFQIISSMNNYWPVNHMSISRLQLFHNTCLRSSDDSFPLDAWMLRFLLGFTQDIEDRDVTWSQGYESTRAFDHLRKLLDI
ncbi:hypothetical protein DER46DRAFT_640308 [Fusarium sp. MPI-SDFR-AT-0072]|nr:hypothetical protein DER46DRAFT_640308 [Fusarium sp. MPI-SDFR-AT-0072]